MTSRSSQPNGALNPGALHQPQAGAGRFVLTLCTLPARVTIRPPQSPQLRHFTFFTSQARDFDGGEQIHLQMGYFDTLAEAEKCAESVRRRYPTAYAALAPRTSEPAAHDRDLAPANSESLTDSQVLRILETRSEASVADRLEENRSDEISLLRPEDTSVLRALKEAVVQGAPVSFAVQLHWSTRPIDLDHVRALPIFRTHILYATESRRNGHCRHFLRLGFFADPSAAKRVAAQARRTFASAAVVPVLETEVTRAREAGAHTSAIPYLPSDDVDYLGDSYEVEESPMEPRSLGEVRYHVPARARAVKERHDQRSERDIWTEPDSLSESGVRHLSVEVQEQLSGRWRKIRLSEQPPGEMEASS